MPHPTDVHVGQRIREARLAKGMTQTDLGNSLGISFQQVQKYEKGTNRVGSSRLWEVCKVLDQPITFFFEGLGRGSMGEPEPALSSRAIKLAKEIDEISDDNVKTHFLKLVRSYAKSA
ncbi:MAG: helix-turn-helix transcriptional regulator [Rhodospirillaceae bacterium]|jgi:transcriptional regulator with XRE-family HTH domain